MIKLSIKYNEGTDTTQKNEPNDTLKQKKKGHTRAKNMHMTKDTEIITMKERNHSMIKQLLVFSAMVFSEKPLLEQRISFPLLSEI